MRSRLAGALSGLLAAACVGPGDGPASPRPESVYPSSWTSGSSTRITIRGEGFLARPREQQSGGGAEVDARHRVWLEEVELGEVEWLNARTLEATVPAGLTVGRKRLVVENAFGLRGALDDAFAVTASPTGTLEVALGVAPATLNVGQPATATFTVRNGGGAALRDVVPEALALGGDAAAGAAVVGPSPASAARLEPGASTAFTWEVTAATPGALTLTAAARAVDEPSSLELSSAAVEASAAVQMPAELAAVVAAGRATANVGQAIAVTLTLTNGGAARADLAEVTAETVGPAASCGPVTPAMPQSVAAGGALELTWTCTASAAGTLSLGAAVVGVDGTSGDALAVAPVAAQVAVQTPAALSAALAVEGSPSTVLVGAPLAVTLTVQDTGEAGANVTLVDWGVTPAGSAACGAPSPAPPQAIPGLGATSFTWSCTALRAGGLTLSATVAGTDANTGEALETAPAGVALQAEIPAILIATVAASPGTANVGQAVTITFTLTNGGTAVADITAVTPSPVAACGSATPATASVPGRQSRTFTWTCTGAAPGTLVLTGTATGTDGASGAPLSVTPEVPASVTVQSPAALGGTLESTPSEVAVSGQSVDVRLVLTNSDPAAAAADGVEVEAWVTPSGGPACTQAAPTTPQRIAGGAAVEFAWTCTIAASGAHALGATVSATDSNTGQPLAPTIAPLPITVQTPAALAVVAFTVDPPSTLNTGQAAVVTLELENGGETAATVTVVRPLMAPESTPGCAAASPAPPQPLPAGGRLTFTWTCAASAAGSYTLGAEIAGTDALTGAPLSASGGPLALEVQGHAALTAEIAVAAGSPLVVGQVVPVSLTVSNAEGGADASVTEVIPTWSGAAATCTAVTGLPRTIAGGGSAVFDWTCTPAAIGTLALGASVGGTDLNTGASLQASAAPVTREVVSGTALSITSFTADRAIASVGQPVGMTLVVGNGGLNPGNVGPVVPSMAGGAATCAPASLPARDVPAGGSVTFEWTCTAGAAGGYLLDATVEATDAAGQPVPLDAAEVPVTVQAAASFAAATVQASRAAADVGQPVTLELVLTNTGGAAAEVSSAAPSVSGSGAADCDGPSGVPLTIAGGASFTLQWTCTGTAAGDVTLSAAVAAEDANSGADASPAVTGAAVLVQTPAALAATLTLDAPAVPVGTPVGVTLALYNAGQATARVTGVAPTISGDTAACTSPSEPPPDVTGGETATFRWTCTATEERRHEVGAEVVAEDVNTGAALVVTVPPAELDVTAASEPEPTGEGVVLVAVDPLGDGTSEPLLGEAGGAVWVGPGQDGVTLAFLDPAGLEAPVLAVVEPLVDGSLLALPVAEPGTLVLAAPSTGEAPSADAAVAALGTLFSAEGIVYAADASGIARSAAAPEGTSWIDVTPAHPAWWARASVAVEPATASAPWPARDRAVPSMVAFGRCGEGPCLFTARNVVGVPGEEPAVAAQLWRCAPSGGPAACWPGDWSLAAPDADAPLTRLGEPASEALTVLAATARWLYVGLDCPSGVRLFRAAAAPLAAADLVGRAGCAAGSPGCEGLGGDGLGDPRVTRFIDAKVLEAGGVTSLWIVAGDGAGPARVYRVDD